MHKKRAGSCIEDAHEMSDLISRQGAIEYFMTNTNWHDEDGYPIEDAEEKRKLLTDYFNGIPSAQQWIPCSERLPEITKFVLVCDVDGEISIARLDWDEWVEDSLIWISEAVQAQEWEWDLDEIKAWMPLPEPWREKQ